MTQTTNTLVEANLVMSPMLSANQKSESHCEGEAIKANTQRIPIFLKLIHKSQICCEFYEKFISKDNNRLAQEIGNYDF